MSTDSLDASNIAFQPESMTPVDEQRCYVRHRARGRATLYRSSDRMRMGLATELWDIAVEGVSVVSPVPLVIGEMLQFSVHNDIQRYARDLRGVVRWCDPWDTNKFRVGIELFVRLPGGEISLLKGIGLSEATQHWM